ncbi:MAG: adenylyltransferase/cytidyltransferase family protein [Cytophagales bacterium]|jgi:HTH-type transcriptional repressor of NAD biosynthesis genes|nr:adenylyltransferase/cytidyltransferase family protein [Cytophagales bacterium]
MFKIGFCGGKMLPVHIGHVFSIRQAAQQCAELHVFLFHSSLQEQLLISKSIFPKDLLQPAIREKILREEFKNEKNIFIYSIDGQRCVSQDAMLNDDNFANAEFLIEIVKKNPEAVFSGEPSYSNFFKKIYPQAQHIIIDEKRKNFPTSGILVRSLEFKNALPLLPESYKYLFKKFLEGNNS